MGQILFAGGGGGTVGSDDLTAKKEWVLEGKTYIGNDTDDDIGTGTMKNVAAIDYGPSLAVSGNNLYCRMTNGAHIQNAGPGYPEVAYSLDKVRSAINYTNASKVLNDTTICGMTGTMPNRGQWQYTTGFGSGSGYVAFNNIPYGYYGPAADGWAPEVRMTRDNFKTNVINYFGIGSVTNFSVAQYSSQTLLFTWANPSWGMWSGIRIVGKQSGWPSNAEDGTVKWDSASGWLTSGWIATGTWYFRAWNYVTTSSERWYGGYSQASIYNNNISGNATFTYSQSWTVPTAVRQIQYFIVGGGGGAYIGSSNKSSRYSNGGGGGYTATGYANVTPGQTLNIVVGAGGSGGDGNYSSIDGIASASGGKVGTTSDGSGSGGSGGGAGYYGSNGSAGSGGSDGGNGGYGKSNRVPGYGQGSSTRCPWDSVLYAGGGGGGSAYSSGGGGSGSGGGGVGGNYGSTGTFTDATNGAANTGGGGGGVGHDSSTGSAEHTDGGSGIVRIRW